MDEARGEVAVAVGVGVAEAEADGDGDVAMGVGLAAGDAVAVAVGIGQVSFTVPDPLGLASPAVFEPVGRGDDIAVGVWVSAVEAPAVGVPAAAAPVAGVPVVRVPVAGVPVVGVPVVGVTAGDTHCPACVDLAAADRAASGTALAASRLGGCVVA